MSRRSGEAGAPDLVRRTTVPSASRWVSMCYYWGVASSRKDPGVAAVLSLLVPGVGQIYNGDFLRGIFWLIVTPGLWIGSGGLLGWLCHVIAAWTAHRRAHWRNRRLPFGVSAA